MFDRVLATRSTLTLLSVTVIALDALFSRAVLEASRTQMLARTAAWIEQDVTPETFLRALKAQLRARRYRMEAARPRCLSVFRSKSWHDGAVRRAVGAGVTRLRFPPAPLAGSGLVLRSRFSCSPSPISGQRVGFCAVPTLSR